MTTLQRSIRSSVELDNAWEPVRNDAPGEAVERFTRLIYASHHDADYLWARGRARILLARQLESSEEYSKAIDDFRESLLIDVSPLERHSDILPEQEWAFPVYRKFLERCLHVHKNWMSELNRPECFWVASPAIRLAAKTATAIVNSHVRDDSLIDSLLPYTQFKPTFSCCPFRNALASTGWSPQSGGFALVTQEDLDSPSQFAEQVKKQSSFDALCELLKNAAVSEEEFSALHSLHDELSECTVETLFSSITSTDRFRRAIGRFILRIFGRHLAAETYANDLNDSHRFVRLVAISGVGGRLGELNLEHDGAELVEGIEHLLRVAGNDRAAACRTAAIRYIGEAAPRIRGANKESLFEECRQTILKSISSKQRHLVLAAIRAARSFGDLDENMLSKVSTMTFPQRHRFDTESDEWRMIVERVTTVLVQVPDQDSLASAALKDLTNLMREPFHEIRLAAMQAALTVVQRKPKTRTKFRPHLLERSVIDDCKQVRSLSQEALAVCD